MATFSINKILDHPDKDEIISKLIIGISENDIHDWLKNKYQNPAEIKYVLGQKYLTIFHKRYLNIYQKISEDLVKTKQIQMSPEDAIDLSIKGNVTYKNKLNKLLDDEIDIKQMMVRMLAAMETRAEQIFDEIQQDPRNINTRIDRVLKEWFETLGANIDRYNRIVNNIPDKLIQHNITLQVVDQQISVFHDAIKETLAQMDIETSLLFMELFHEKMSKLQEAKQDKLLPTETRLAEAKLLSEQITSKLDSK